MNIYTQPLKMNQRHLMGRHRNKLLMAVTLLLFTGSTGADPWNNLLRKTIQAAAPFADAMVIAETEMEELRGGFSIAGMDVNFGATVRTMVNDVRYETVLSFNPVTNRVETQSHGIVSGAGAPGVTVVEVGPNSGVSVQSVTPEHVSLPGVKDFNGVVINGADGFTAALHDVTRNAILSTVVSDASNQKIEQKLNIDIQIKNMKAIEAAHKRSRIINSLIP